MHIIFPLYLVYFETTAYVLFAYLMCNSDFHFFRALLLSYLTFAHRNYCQCLEGDQTQPAFTGAFFVFFSLFLYFAAVFLCFILFSLFS